jgi:hypothetical protein
LGAKILVATLKHPSVTAHYLTKVNWFQQLPDYLRHYYGKPIEVWSSDIYVQDEPAMFIPIQRIISTLNINCSFFITPKCQNIR